MAWKSLSRMDLNTLVVLATLLEEEHVSRAAMRLNLSQPSVSRALGKLRRQLEDPLFTRTQHGLKPTPRAEALRQPLARLLDELGAVLAPPRFEPGSSQRRFILATTDYGVHALLAPTLAQWRSQAPGTDLEVRHWSAGLDHHLDEEGVHLAICVLGSQPPARIHGRGLGDDHFVCVMRAGHPLSGSAPLTLAQYLGAEHGLISMGGDEKGAIDRILEGMGHQRQVVLRVPHFMAAFSAIAQSDLLLTVPGCLAASLSSHWPIEIRTLPFSTPRFHYSMVWHDRWHQEPGHRWFRGLIFDQLVPAVEDLRGRLERALR